MEQNSYTPNHEPMDLSEVIRLGQNFRQEISNLQANELLSEAERASRYDSAAHGFLGAIEPLPDDIQALAWLTFVKD